jgi:hypothetical protein
MKKLLQAGTILLLLAVIGWLIWRPLTYRTDTGTTVKRAQMDMYELLTAMNAHQATYGCYPFGKTAEVFAILRGNNPQKVVFLNVDRSNDEGSGDWLDPWKTPYQIVFDSTNRFTILCAGQNKVFGDQDDLKLSNLEGN